MPQELHEILSAALQLNGVDFYKKKVPQFILENLPEGYGQRDYQKEAFGRFAFYWEDYQNKPQEVPIQLLYHMATGSGKTLVMAGLMLYLYEKGYRNFLFFVNSTNIIEKTRDNFLNPSSLKYLFSEVISIHDKRINIREVDNFQTANKEDINIAFSTIQGLHVRLNTPKENSITYEDFKEYPVVLISDEAHHINAETKKGSELSKDEIADVISWEQTVWKIFNANSDNILLEFTATADLADPEIVAKYQDKVIYDYPLKQFRIDGYSKEVKTLQADLESFDRALQALILSQYRRKILEQRNLAGNPNKPVILFKSRTIKESQEFHEDFAKKLKSLSNSKIQKIKSLPEKDNAITKAFSYFEQNGITIPNLIEELKEEFSQDKCISVNSKDESEAKQIAINELEKPDNEYRAIFAVNKLNEGWDVLNLFDIVRLYNTRDAKSGKPGKTTMSEAQLIGRGARYCPFQISPEQPRYQRKYDVMDNNDESDYKICEELYYHSAYNPRYIDELHTALDEIGIKPKETLKRQLKLKLNFMDSDFYKSQLLFLNEQIKYNREDVFGLGSSTLDTIHKIQLRTGFTKTSLAFEKQNQKQRANKYKDYKLIEFGLPVIRKAINKIRFFEFDNLQKYLPNVKSISELITSNNYLGGLKVEVHGLEDQVEKLSQHDKLNIALQLLEKISTHLQSNKVEKKGTKEFKPFMLKERIFNKTISISADEEDGVERSKGQNDTNYEYARLDLTNEEWYVFNDNYGTSEEKYFVKFIHAHIEKLKAKYDFLKKSRPRNLPIIKYLSNLKEVIY
jgi:type III restriction enzyme